MPLFSNVPRLHQLDLQGRRVFVRADINVPLSPYGAVLDDSLLRALVPTLRVLVEAKCKIVVAGHYGITDPIGGPAAPRRIARCLSELLGAPVRELGREYPRGTAALVKGEVALAPDLSSYPGEQANDADWAMTLAQSVDVYVGDAVRAASHPWASVATLPRMLPERGAGLSMGAELDLMEAFVESPAHPYTAVIGGDSVLRKAALLNALLLKADTLLLGGVVANTFLVAQSNMSLGASRFEPNGIETARQILAAAHAAGIDIRVPVDAVVARRAGQSEQLVYDVRPIDRIGADESVIDVAHETCSVYREVLVRSATVLWNGPMGACSDENSRSGTYRMAQNVTESARNTLLTGDDTIDAVRFFGLEGSFRHLSRGGEASLALLSGQVCPGIESLRR